jgi:hypothetical protein
MRRVARVDDNHADVVAALRRAGCSVQSLAPLGRGVPDLLVGVAGQNRLFEVKDGAKAPSRQRLTEDELEWHATWNGNVVTVTSAEEALRVVCEIRNGGR